MLNTITAFAIAFAGVVHLVLAPQHYEHSPAHGIFFLLAGVAELAWAYAFWKRPSQRLYYIGLGLAGGLFVLWAMTRFLPSPFEHTPGEIDLGGVVCKISELIGFGALVLLAANGQIKGLAKGSATRLAVIAFGIALVSGVFTFGAGHAVEPLFPSLAGSGHDETNPSSDHDESSGDEPEHSEGSDHDE